MHLDDDYIYADALNMKQLILKYNLYEAKSLWKYIHTNWKINNLDGGYCLQNTWKFSATQYSLNLITVGTFFLLKERKTFMKNIFKLINIQKEGGGDFFSQVHSSFYLKKWNKVK